ncbi:MAG: FkbM family methyltransferase [Anaerolineae bacterium]|nr:FkbM family methyltransferase [Anaerolineae bacterium]
MLFQNLLSSIQNSLGFSLSFLIYYGLPFHHRALTQIYTPFIQPGDLCFDLGAHLGDRIRAWSQLGAHIIALEPNPAAMRWLRRLYGNRPNIVLIEQAVGAHPGEGTFWISRLTPSISTLSHEWLSKVQKTPRFAGARWQEHIPVTVTTLDALIAQYGKPAFCKIDVEGAELDVLKGLSQALPALSFEYIPATIETALGCIDRLSQLGNYEYNWRVSEFPRLRSQVWLSPQAMTTQLQRMTRDSNSGDVYARLTPKGAGSTLPV